MSTRGVTGLEAALLRVLLPLSLASGVVLVTGFFFPDIVGEVISGEVWLVVALLFFGAGLAYIALLPLEDVEDDERSTEHLMLQVRRHGLGGTIQRSFRRQDPSTAGIPVATILVFLAIHLVFTDATLEAIELARRLMLEEAGWIFIGPMLVAVVTCLVLLVSPWGSIRLGGPDAEPTYTLPVYFTMFFTAGIAAGIVFWGPAEALFHYDAPPPYLEASARSEGVITGALMYSLFHWGFSAWSAYLIVGLPIAYAVFQRGAPLRVSAILSPFLGVENLDHPLGKLVDVLAIFATIGGIATSVALVSQQFLTGIDFQWGVATGDVGPVVFVAGLTAVFVISAQSGVHRGIRRIANVNIILFAFVGLLLLALGPRDVLLSNGAAAIGEYGVNILPLSLEFGDQWVADWTVWNWVWWFSWAPFAGLFLAALSRGRTIRTVVLTGFVATSLATMVWFLIFGSVALELQHTGQVDVLGAIAAGGSEAVAAFPILSALPLSELLIFLLLAMIIVFMTTSADTSTLVVSVLSTRAGDAPTPGSIGFWGTFQGLVAVAVMLTGGEAALQTAAVLLGGPIAIIAVIAIAGLLLELVRDGRDEGVPVGSGSGD